MQPDAKLVLPGSTPTPLYLDPPTLARFGPQSVKRWPILGPNVESGAQKFEHSFKFSPAPCPVGICQHLFATPAAWRGNIFETISEGGVGGNPDDMVFLSILGSGALLDAGLLTTASGH